MTCPGSWPACRVPAGQLPGQVVDLVGNVVHAGAAAGEEPADRRVRAEGGEQLDVARTDPEGCSLDALLVLRRTLLELGAEEPLVGRDRPVEVVDGEPEMVNAFRAHPPRSYRSASVPGFSLASTPFQPIARTVPTVSAARDSGSMSAS